MANIDAPRGFRPIGNGAGGTAPRVTLYVRALTGILYEGAPLVKNTSNLAEFDGVTDASATDSQETHDRIVIGVCAHYVAAADTDVYIYDDPAQEFLVQGDSAVGAPFEAVSKYCSLLNMATGNTTSGHSKCEIDSSEITQTRDEFDIVQIKRLYNEPDNDQDAVNAKWVVTSASTCHILGLNSGTRMGT